MNIWNKEISTAPHDRKVWLATKCGKVSATYWDKKREAWSGMKAGEAPIAWQPYEMPEHPARMTRSNAMDELVASSAEELFPQASGHFILDDVGSGA